MVTNLKNHPFNIDAFFERSVVLTFAVHKKDVEPLLPKPFRSDTYRDEWAFVAVALVKTKNLRPSIFPKFLGRDFNLVGYRIFVRYKNRQGKNLRGLYILKSETDKKAMEWLGSTFTQYAYTTTDISFSQRNERMQIESGGSGFKIEIEDRDTEIPLPKISPFHDWKAARRFAGPLPFTFTFNPKAHEVLIVEGVRKNWKPKPVQVHRFQIPFLESLRSDKIVLASAFQVENIPYHWKKGKIEKWQS